MRFFAIITTLVLGLCASAAPAPNAEALVPFLNPDYCTNRGGECTDSDGKKGTCSCSMSATSPSCLCISG